MELEHEGESIVLAVPDAVLGRTSASEIHVSHPLVSRRHCRFEATPDGVFVEDLGSSNGTFLDGERLAGRRRIVVGDVVQIGQGGPRLALLMAIVNGRDVGQDVPGEDQETILSGDPRAAAFRARVEVSPAAAPTRDVEDATTRDSDITPAEEPGETTGSIPVATPIDAVAESLLGATDILPPPEPATRPVRREGHGEEGEPSTRPASRTQTAPRGTAGTPGEPAAPEATRPVGRRPGLPPTVSGSSGPPARPDTAPGATAGATPGSRARGRGVVLGFVVGLLIALALGVLTPLGATLHGLAPWAASEAPPR